MASVEDRKNGSYRLTVILGYDEKGVPIRERKTVKAKNKTEAKKMLTIFEAEILKGKYIKVNKLATLRDFYKDWLEKYAQEEYSPKTLQNYINDLNTRVLPVLGHMKLAEIEPIHVVNFMNKIKKDGQRLDGKPGKLASSTIRNIFNALNSVLSCAVEWRYISENPATPAKPKKPTHKKSEVYTKQEVDHLIEILAGCEFRWMTLILLALSTGAREGEIAALEFKHIDFDNCKIKIEQSITPVKGKGLKVKSTKNGKERTVSVPKPLIEMLDKLHTERKKEKLKAGDKKVWEDHFFVFANEFGKPLRPDSIYQWWSRLTTKYKMKHIRFHELRHTSATLLINEGVHAKVISERLGHGDISTTMNIYGHVLQEADETAANHFDSLFKKKA